MAFFHMEKINKQRALLYFFKEEVELCSTSLMKKVEQSSTSPKGGKVFFKEKVQQNKLFNKLAF